MGIRDQVERPSCASRARARLASGSGCNDVFDNAGANYSQCDAPEGEFSLDPRFCDAEAGDFTWVDGTGLAHDEGEHREKRVQRRDHYRNLGVSMRASQKEIEIAF